MPNAAIWTLENVTSANSAAIANRSILSADDGDLGSGDSIIGMDGRIPTLRSDYMDGGRYRSIVKIKARYADPTANDGSIWMMGTGWLIRPDLLVTAAHVVYDWSRQLGAAREIKCYVGYTGRDSLSHPSVQCRSGARVVAPGEWLQDTAQRDRAKDVAFVQIDRPFSGNLQVFTFVDTPESSTNSKIGIVGYPGDKYARDFNGQTELGAQMYEEFLPTTYDLGDSKSRLIQYKISTFGGQAGAPIVDRSNNHVIGMHCYGGGGNECNYGNAIGGKYGVDYKSYLTVFDSKFPEGVGKATLIPLPSN